MRKATGVDPHKMTVLIADDEDEFRNAFIANHGGSGVRIEQLSDVYQLPEHLASSRQLPDLVVVDLYRTRDDPGTDEARQSNARVNGLLAKLEEVTGELKPVVDQLKTPAAIKVLRDIRAVPRLADMPVLIYTRQGLSLLSDDEIREAIHLGAEWMLKGRSAVVERAQMAAFLRTAACNKARVKRDVALTVAGAVLGTAISQVIQWLI